MWGGGGYWGQSRGGGKVGGQGEGVGGNPVVIRLYPSGSTF